MNTYEIQGTYGSAKTETAIYCRESRHGSTWYVCHGSLNVNLSPVPLEDGEDIETIADIDTFTVSTPIESLDDLDEHLDS